MPSVALVSSAPPRHQSPPISCRHGCTKCFLLGDWAGRVFAAISGCREASAPRPLVAYQPTGCRRGFGLMRRCWYRAIRHRHRSDSRRLSPIAGQQYRCHYHWCPLKSGHRAIPAYYAHLGGSSRLASSDCGATSVPFYFWYYSAANHRPRYRSITNRNGRAARAPQYQAPDCRLMQGHGVIVAVPGHRSR